MSDIHKANFRVISFVMEPVFLARRPQLKIKGSLLILL